MKTDLFNPTRHLSVLALPIIAVWPCLAAHDPAELASQTYAGLTINGTVGAVYSIEYVSELTQEWCQDWFGDYAGGIAVDPQGPATGLRRVFRGGNWDWWPDFPGLCRSAIRGKLEPGNRFVLIGFRVVLDSGQP